MISFENQEENIEQQNKIHFTKMHGLGNDYLLINCIDNKNIIEEQNIPPIARYLCNRHFGVGADGIILINKSNIADFKMNIYNQDGTEAEMCGNGIRCFAKYIYDNRLTEKKEIRIETLAGIKNAFIRKSKINNDIREITIDMGKAKYEQQLDLKILEKELEVYCISMGNPHAIVFCEDVEKVPISEIGSLIENDEHFPQKTNVEFIQVLGNSSIKMRVWERGVGETYACGTGACAVATLCHKLNFTKSDVTVYLKGGELKIEIDEANQEIYMTGIATKVFDGEIIKI